MDGRIPIRRLASYVLALALTWALLASPGHVACSEALDFRLDVTRAGKLIRSLGPADLEALPQKSFTTSTQWTDGQITFSGPALVDVLDHLGWLPEVDNIELLAANRYSIPLLPELLDSEAPIVATRRGGCPFGLSELGPLWVVFPYDSHSRFRKELVYFTSIWQLIEIRFAK